MSPEGGAGSSWQDWVDGADLPVEPPLPKAADEEFLRRLSLPLDEEHDDAPLGLSLPTEPAATGFEPPAAAPAPAPTPAAASTNGPLLPRLVDQVQDARDAVDSLTSRLDRLETMLETIVEQAAHAAAARDADQGARLAGSIDDRLDEQGAQLALVVEELSRLRKRLPIRAREGSAVDEPMVERMADVIVERLSGQFEVVVEPDPDPEPAPAPKPAAKSAKPPSKRAGRAPLRAGQNS